MTLDQRPIANKTVDESFLGLSKEEKYFLDLIQKTRDQIIKVKYLLEGPQIDNFASFSSYYTASEVILLLESLVLKKILEKKEKGSILLCPKCGSHACISILACPKCSSSKVSRNIDLTHPECDYSGPQQEFIDGVILRCPRCKSILNEKALEGDPEYFNVSDTYFKCQDCGTPISKSQNILICIKCNHKFSSIQGSLFSMISYILISDFKIKQKTLQISADEEKLNLRENIPDQKTEKIIQKSSTFNIEKSPRAYESDKPLLDPIKEGSELEKLEEKADLMEIKADSYPREQLRSNVKNNSNIIRTVTKNSQQKKSEILPKEKLIEVKPIEKNYHWWGEVDNDLQGDKPNMKEEITRSFNKNVKVNTDSGTKKRTSKKDK
ncbi:MAG: hypothetical protein E4G94_02100 [ANME-2 cluster archaeon]|nr:MAG: hypothetical protein E4G94_02100 [ANME-2 cluster archaeon]